MSSRVKGIEFPYFYLSVPFSSWGASLLRKRVEDLSVGGDVATFLRDEELGVFVLDDMTVVVIQAQSGFLANVDIFIL